MITRTTVAAAVLSVMAGVASAQLGAQAPDRADDDGVAERTDLLQGRRADLLQELHELPPPGRDRPDVAADVQGCASLGEVDCDPGVRRARCRRGTPIRRTATFLNDRRLSRGREGHDRDVGERGRAGRQPDRLPAAPDVRDRMVDREARRGVQHGRRTTRSRPKARSLTSTSRCRPRSLRTSGSRRWKCAPAIRACSTTCSSTRARRNRRRRPQRQLPHRRPRPAPRPAPVFIFDRATSAIPPGAVGRSGARGAEAGRTRTIGRRRGAWGRRSAALRRGS